jgi:type IV secretory pathway VirB2 component (pilin)
MEHISTMTTEPSPTPKRPLGVWLLTIYAVLTGAIMQLFALAAAGFIGLELSAGGVLFTLTLALSIVFAAFGAWRGSNKARIALLVLITLHYVVIAINNALLLFDGTATGNDVRFIGRILRGFLYPALYIWYFGRRETMQFYIAQRKINIQQVEG